MKYDFTLKFRLPVTAEPMDLLVERLGDAGCDDAIVGIGLVGRLALNFTREASSASEAVSNALCDVRKAIPDAELIEVSPDYVGLSDVAEMVGVSRQNMRGLMTAHADFPAPIHTGVTSQVQIWHLEAVLHWLKLRAGYEISPRLLEVAHMARHCNLMREVSKFDPDLQERFGVR